MSRMFCGLPVSPDPKIKSAWLVEGRGHERYLEFWTHYGEYEAISYDRKDRPVTELDPACIHGIVLDRYALDHPEAFWRQHRPGGTLGSFLEIAGKIPDVRSKLAAGYGLRELVKDPELGTCAAIYFGMERPDALSVMDLGDNCYWFQSDGRHRALAARMLNYKIPAVVLGRMARKSRL